MDKPRENILTTVGSFMQNREYDKVEYLLKKMLDEMPHNWKPIVESENSANIAFWDMEEFISFTEFNKKRGWDNKTIFWTSPSYTHVLYLLAYIAVERKDWRLSHKYINESLVLEPDNPTLLSEKAMILSSMGNKEEAYKTYMKAITIRPWSTNKCRAKAMRGAGVTLIDMGKLEEAQRLLEESLKLEPDNELAKREILYIKQLQKK